MGGDRRQEAIDEAGRLEGKVAVVTGGSTGMAPDGQTGDDGRQIRRVIAEELNLDPQTV